MSARQMLEWVDGRNGSSFGSISWGGNTLNFTIVPASGSDGLRAMVPMDAAPGRLIGDHAERNTDHVLHADDQGCRLRLLPGTGGRLSGDVCRRHHTTRDLERRRLGAIGWDRHDHMDHERGFGLAGELRYVTGIADAHRVGQLDRSLAQRDADRAHGRDDVLLPRQKRRRGGQPSRVATDNRSAGDLRHSDVGFDRHVGRRLHGRSTGREFLHRTSGRRRSAAAAHRGC